MIARRIGALMLAAVCASGCARFNSAIKKQDDVAQQNKERRAETVRIFEGKRDRAQFEAAQGRWQAGDTSGCHDQLKQLLARSPKHLEARLLSAELALFEDRPDTALEHVHQAIADHPGNPQVEHTLALILESQGQSSEALTHYKRAAELEPDSEVYQLSYQSAQEGAVTRPGAKESDVSQASWETVSDMSAHAASPPPPVTTDLTRLTDQLGTKQLLSKGAAALAEGDESEAISWLTKAMTAEPDNSRIPLRAAAQALQLEQPEVALKLLAIARQRFPDSADAARMSGAAQYRRGDYQAAELALQQALSLDKGSGLTYFLMGCTLHKLGKDSEAAGNFDSAARLDARFAVQR